FYPYTTLFRSPYLIAGLTLEKLSQQMQISPRALSEIINRQFDCNFFEFINGYRVAEARRLLEDPANKRKTVLDIMYDAGFNSKATFNTLFKRTVDMTPSEYRKQAESRKLIRV